MKTATLATLHHSGSPSGYLPLNDDGNLTLALSISGATPLSTSSFGETTPPMRSPAQQPDCLSRTRR